ncbi:MAG: DUF1345 domain-containing protein [Herbaspirillum sp.]
MGIAIGLLYPGDLDWVTRSLLGWNSAVWLYLILIGTLMLRASPAEVKATAEDEDESAQMMLLLVCIAAVASLAAILLELVDMRGNQSAAPLFRYGFTLLTIAGSWLLVATFFTLHYARMFYNAGDKAPLRFPEEETNPDYWDFLYFSFTIAVAVQTSDVVIMTRAMRRIVLLQSVLTFVFNVAILGLSINIAAGLVGN